MNIKNKIFTVSIIIMALCLLIGAVSAADIDDAVVGSDVNSQVDSGISTEEISTEDSNNDEVLTENNNGQTITDPSPDTQSYDTVYVVNHTVEVPEGVAVPYVGIDEGIKHTNDQGTVVITEGVYIPESTIIIDRNLTIVGENNNVIIDGTLAGRIFEVNSEVNVNLINLTFVNGHADKGGAIYNNGNLTVYRCMFDNNTVDEDGTGVNIYSTGSLNVSSSIILNNEITKYAIYTYRGAPAIANKNWWGTNTPSDIKPCNFNLDNYIVLKVLYEGTPVVRQIYSVVISANTLNTGEQLVYGEFIPNVPVEIIVDNKAIYRNASEVNLELMLNPLNASADIIIKFFAEEVVIDVDGAPLNVSRVDSRGYADYLDDITVTVAMDDPNAQGYVTFVVNDTVYNGTLKYGRASFVIPGGLDAGIHYFDVFYSGDDSYNSTVTENGLTLRVRPLSTTVSINTPDSTYEFYNLTIKASVTNSKNLNVTGSLFVTYIIEGVEVANETLSIEQARSFIYENLAKGNLTVRAVYSAGINFSNSTVESKVMVKETEYNITANNIKVTYNDGKKLTATLYKNGEVLAGEYVTLSIAGKTVKALTNSEGVVSFALNYANGVYNSKLSYNTTTKSVTVTIVKANTKFTGITKSVKRNKYFQVKLLDAKNQVIKSASIVLRIGKKSKTIKTNAKGIAKLKITTAIAKVGKNKVNLSFRATKFYNGKSAKFTLTVKK